MTTTILVEILGTLRQGVFTPAHPVVSTRLESAHFLIGSRPRPGPAVVLGDGTVSGEHAEVSVEAGQWCIRDLNSDNGLFLLRGAAAVAAGLPFPGAELPTRSRARVVRWVES